MFNNSMDKKRPSRAGRKDAILDAFETLIGQFGMDKTTMQEIAYATGISVGTLYNEFKDKDALIDALVDRIESQVTQKIEQIHFTSESPEGQLYEFVIMVSDIVTELTKSKRSVIDYFLTGTGRFRYIGKKMRAKSQASNIVEIRIKETINDGIKQGIFEVKDIDLVARVISQAYLTYLMAQIFIVEQEFHQEEDYLRKEGIRLLIKGLRKK